MLSYVITICVGSEEAGVHAYTLHYNLDIFLILLQPWQIFILICLDAM